MAASRLSKPASHPLLMWYARCPTLTALGLIANRGVLTREFLRENVSLVPVRDNTTPAVRQGYFDHSLPHLLREADAATALWAQAHGGRTALLAAGATYHNVIVAVRPEDALSEVSDLKGVKLSVPHESGPFSPARARAEWAWRAIGDFAGLLPDDVKLTPLRVDAPSAPYGDVTRRDIEALKAGRTDAILLYGARGIESLRQSGLKALHRFAPEDIATDPRLEGLIEQRVLTVDPLLFETHADVIRRIGDRLNEVASWAADFPKEALNQAALEAGASIEDTAAAHGSLLAESARLTLEPAALARLGRLRTWLVGNGLIVPPEGADGPGDWSPGDWNRSGQERVAVMA